MLKKFRPITPSLRQLVLPANEKLTRADEKKGRKLVKPTKSLLLPKRRTNGRNNKGHITCRHKGGGHKRKYRIIDFKRDKIDIPAKVASIEYDPNRSAYIALLNYADGEKRYIIASQGLKKGDMVQTSDKPPYSVGCCMKLKDMPLGSIVHNIEIQPGRGGKLVRSAGLFAQLMARSDGNATIRMPSGEVRLVNENCRATFGVVSNPEHNLRVEGKAGRNRWKGIRPTVRGVVMNPVDHPHGGGEGKSKGNIPQSPWGTYVGVKTRSNKKSTKHVVKSRKKKK
ncbi:MAG: 50S ribosomal protein L2 [Chlamydiae bacterium]|nr:50S ribosomal protein L2 [Chlamydiota bacterium]